MDIRSPKPLDCEYRIYKFCANSLLRSGTQKQALCRALTECAEEEVRRQLQKEFVVSTEWRGTMVRAAGGEWFYAELWLVPPFGAKALDGQARGAESWATGF